MGLGFKRCPSAVRWEQAREVGLDRQLQAHLDRCPRCARNWTTDTALVHRLRALPGADLKADLLASGKAQLLARAQSETDPAASAQHRAPSTGGIVACFGVALAAWPLVASEGTRLQTPSTTNRKPPVQAVADGSQDQSQQVCPAREPTIRTATDNASRADTRTPPADVSPHNLMELAATRRPVPEAGPHPKGKTVAGEGNRSEDAFREGWAALRAHHPGLAAAWFGQVAPDSSLDEDARYWRGVSLARAGRLRRAAAALSTFMERYPHSLRRNQVAVVLGWVYVRREQAEEAATYFAQGLLADSAETREQAARGLAMVQGRPL